MHVVNVDNTSIEKKEISLGQSLFLQPLHGCRIQVCSVWHLLLLCKGRRSSSSTKWSSSGQSIINISFRWNSYLPTWASRCYNIYLRLPEENEFERKRKQKTYTEKRKSVGLLCFYELEAHMEFHHEAMEISGYLWSIPLRR
ncbi:hypothetical protein OUZ56_015399 [Daphnia magna]|uniref:Uncharacterized protein n=1 Tax=Daphnia magna TaxID=35525 RepID=A0ABR0AMQ9_9CRUS|nr:hypothetical protein OUZ56_015399 [Daphnia magna]